MDQTIACHNIANSCAKLFVESNAPEYKKLGYSKLIEDFTSKYSEAYQQAQELLKASSKKATVIDRKKLGL